MKQLVIATFNKHKLRELIPLCRRLGIKPLSLEAFPHVKPPREDGKTFEENAMKKARFIARETGLPSLADDSGICVDALGGAPGVDSARYAGSSRDDRANNLKLLGKLEGVPAAKRSAYYYCAIALATPQKPIGTVRGKVRGRILREFRGKGGFGYDVLFYYPPFSKTFAEISLRKKNQVSHRSRALKRAIKLLKKVAEESC
ncbi:MAG: XTP/dITP diphosphatase [Candidatus Omnitrophica bacterium]|nr:XTP/dITP diphosphatase [Candidatus Omnitrophota bacterium]